MKTALLTFLLTLLLPLNQSTAPSQPTPLHTPATKSASLFETTTYSEETPSADTYDLPTQGVPSFVTRVIDGDTFVANYDGSSATVRVIGIDTPETVRPNTPLECFGSEASSKAKELLMQKEVILTTDSTQDTYDKYGRFLAYVTLPSGNDFGETMLSEGYAYEYTYRLPYLKQADYQAAEAMARNNSAGLWDDETCIASDNPSSQAATENTSSCVIKGNISYYTKEKIYHVPGQEYYYVTKINEGAGERWFCSESDALTAGWRKAKQ